MRRILALGGHDFSSRPPDRAVCELLLRLASERGGERPRICILPTASGDTSEQIGRFYAAFGERSCEPSDVSLFRLGRRPMALRDHLLAQDLIYVGGGCLVNLLAVWEAHDIASILSLAWRRGIVLAGQSAGAMCWFEAGITKSSGKPLAAAGLGMLSGSLCVHYNNEPERRAAYLEAVGDGMPGGYGLDDYAGLLWEGEGTPRRRHRPPRRPRLPRLQPRRRRCRVAAAGPLPAGPGARRPARGHRRVPPHQDDAQARRLARLAADQGGLTPSGCSGVPPFGVKAHPHLDPAWTRRRAEPPPSPAPTASTRSDGLPQAARAARAVTCREAGARRWCAQEQCPLFQLQLRRDGARVTGSRATPPAGGAAGSLDDEGVGGLELPTPIRSIPVPEFPANQMRAVGPGEDRLRLGAGRS